MELFAILLIIGLVIAGESIIYRKYGLKGIEYDLDISKDEVFEGEEVELIETVSNKKYLPVPWLKSEISASRWLEFRGGVAKASDKTESRFIPSIFSLKANQKCTRVWKVTCLKRGVFTFKNTTVITTDILGLTSASTYFPVLRKITVLPVPCDVGEGDLSKKELQGEIIVKRFINEDPFVISGSKEYTGREPINRIHWNATARQNQLMVFNNEYSTNQNLLILMNMQAKSFGNVSCTNIRNVETFIRISAKLMYDSLNKGIRSGFASNGGGIDGFFIPPENNSEQYLSILRKLAELESECSVNFSLFCDKINTSYFTDIAIITQYVDDNMLEFGHRMNRYNKNVIFYTNDEANTHHQLIPVNRISFAFGGGFLNDI